MDKKSDIRSAIDQAKLLGTLAVFGGLFALGLAVAVMWMGMGMDALIRSDLFMLGLIPYATALLFSVGAFLYGVLGSGAAQEEEEKMLLVRRKENHLLNVEEDVRFTAGRTFANYKRFAPYVLSALASLAILGMVIYFYRYWNVVRPGAVVPEEMRRLDHQASQTTVATISAIFMILSVFAGAFFIGQARGITYRWLRPVGAWLVAGFALMLFSCLSAIFRNWDVLVWFDETFAKVFLVVFVILAFELIVNFIIEFYRPRTMEENRPIFESKLLSIFTEPGGVMRNIADMLDYQFGFKVSGTWIYSFIEKALFPLIIVWVVILWGFTSIHQVDIGEVGVREEFGRVVDRELLNPGIYFTKPWPFGKISTFSCMKLQQLVVGEQEDADDHAEEEEEDDGHGHAPKPKKEKKPKEKVTVISWTEAHAHADSFFLVSAGQKPSDTVKNDSNARAALAVDMVGFSMPVQYRIRRDGVFDYAYLNNDTPRMLQKISEEAATRYFASASLVEIMSTGRRHVEEAIKKEIQVISDRQKLGVEIVSVNLTDVHPPSSANTAAAFHEARLAQERANAAILNAKVYRDKVIPEAEIAALRINQEALSYTYNNIEVAKAESERFKTQLNSYLEMPAMFKLKSYLDFLERDCADIRKFIISSSMRDEVYELNFEEKGTLDLVDVDLSTLK